MYQISSVLAGLILFGFPELIYLFFCDGEGEKKQKNQDEELGLVYVLSGSFSSSAGHSEKAEKSVREATTPVDT